MTKRLTSTLALMCAMSVGTVGAGFAQNIVTLQSQDEAVNLTGELLSFQDDVYVIRTNLGSLRISADRVECFGEGCPKPEVVAAPVLPDEPSVVTLKSIDGATTITGTLLGFENGVYLMRTGFGELRISADDSTCEGAGCPIDPATLKNVSIAASPELSNGLVKELLAGFADFKGNSFSDTDIGDNQKALVLTAPDGEEFANVTLASSSATDAVQSLIAGNADLAATTRSVLEEERVALVGPAADSRVFAQSERVIALDAIAIAVAPGNPVRTIAEADIARIFSGEVTDWSELGGAPGAINLYVRGADSGTTEVFDQLVMGPARASMSANATVMSSDADTVAALSADPLGIAYTSFSTLGDARALDIRGTCGIQTPANEFTIKTEEYPLTRRIFLYRPSNQIPQPATDFVNFATSIDAQEIVKASGFIGQDVTQLSVNEQGMRFVSALLPTPDGEASLPQIQNMMTDLVAAERLSLTFRFEPGASVLDTRAEADVQRLAQMLKAGAFENKELIVAGFSDSVGDGTVNRDLSQSRAEQVVTAVLQAAGLSNADGLLVNAVGYGELSPLGCNETINGRRVNRRVEIWTKDRVGPNL